MSVAVDLCERFFFAVVLVVSVACGCELNRAAADAGSRTRPVTHIVNASSLIEDEEPIPAVQRAARYKDN